MAESKAWLNQHIVRVPITLARRPTGSPAVPSGSSVVEVEVVVVAFGWGVAIVAVATVAQAIPWAAQYEEWY